MGIAAIIKRITERKSIDKKKYKDYETDMKIQETYEERKKSSNQRELERYYKDKEEERIKLALDKIRKQKTQDVWKSKDGILGVKTTMLNCDRPILKEKNIFAGNNKNMLHAHRRKR